MERRRLLELLVDLEQLRVALVLAAAHRLHPCRANLTQLLGVDRQADDLAGVDLVQLGRRLDPLHDRHVRGLVAEVAEVDRERRLRGAGDADENDVRLVEAAADAVVELDRELDRLHPLEVRRVERRPRAGRHLRRHPGDLRDRLDRVAEQVGVVEPRAAAERAHRLAQLAVDERVDHHRRPPLRPADGELEVVDRLDLRVADLLERLLRKLRLERRDEPRGGLSGRVREDVELDGLAGRVHRFFCRAMCDERRDALSAFVEDELLCAAPRTRRAPSHPSHSAL